MLPSVTVLGPSPVLHAPSLLILSLARLTWLTSLPYQPLAASEFMTAI